MDIHAITESYAVSPQIEPDDVPAIREAGFAAIIDNRPDAEIGPELGAAAIEAACAAAGLAFHFNPFAGQPDETAIRRQREILDAATGPVLAYCRSGTRCSVVWALSRAGTDPVEDILSGAAAAGYDLTGLRPMLEARARG